MIIEYVQSDDAFDHRYDLLEGWCILVEEGTTSSTSFKATMRFEMRKLINNYLLSPIAIPNF
jgi:hypothetical protein